MGKHQPDEIDLAALEWAKQRRIIFGVVVLRKQDARTGDFVLTDKLEPRERLGKLRSTLGAIREDREGAGQGGTFNQDFPEVYLRIALDVHRAFHLMPSYQRVIMDLHYVWREVPMLDRLREAQASEPTYFKTLSAVKSFLRGYLAAVSSASAQKSVVKDYIVPLACVS